MQIKQTRVFPLLLASHLMLAVLFIPMVQADTVPVLYIPPLTISGDQSISIPILVDPAEDLAGVKLVVYYDATCLTYESAAKSDATSGFLHVVNDKKPGELIIVMASAKGISGKEITLITLQLKPVNPTTREKPVKPENQGSPENPPAAASTCAVRITQAELMNVQLKYIRFQIRENSP